MSLCWILLFWVTWCPLYHSKCRKVANVLAYYSILLGDIGISRKVCESIIFNWQLTILIRLTKQRQKKLFFRYLNVCLSQVWQYLIMPPRQFNSHCFCCFSNRHKTFSFNLFLGLKIHSVWPLQPCVLKYSRLFGPFVIYEENEVLWIVNMVLGTNAKNFFSA